MPKNKKRGHPDVEEILERPWCYYCERDFDDLKILISHQKAKHFKCQTCARRLNTAGGLSVHLQQVHKETLTTVENALPNRSDLSVEIFGMEGIPEDIVQQHNQRVIAQFHQDEVNRRAGGGNAGSGGTASKKFKTESGGELKARLAAFKAAKAAKAAGAIPGADSGNDTPPMTGMEDVQTPVAGESPVPAQNLMAPAYGQQQHPGEAKDYASFSPGFAPQPYGMPPQNPFAGYTPGYGPLPVHGPPPGQHVQPGMPQLPGYPHYGHSPFGAGSPPPQAPFQPPYQPPRHASPAQHVPFPRSSGLPNAPGLPQKPSFTPSVSTYQMQQLHQGGHAPGQYAQNGGSSGHEQAQSTDAPTITSADVDNLIDEYSQAKPAPGLATETAATTEATPVPASATAATANTKTAKKGKDKATKLIYSDNEVSPEEKMANLSRYAFDPAQRREDEKKENTVLGEVEAQVTGVEMGSEGVIDKQG